MSGCSEPCWLGISIETTSIKAARQALTAIFPPPDYHIFPADSPKVVPMLWLSKKVNAGEWQGIAQIYASRGVVDQITVDFSYSDPADIPELGYIVRLMGTPTCVQPAYTGNTLTLIYERKLANVIIEAKISGLTWKSRIIWMQISRSMRISCRKYSPWQGLSEQRYLSQPGMLQERLSSDESK